ncbi:hypothetical protein D3C85_1472190 [compost metagenome]
MHEAFSGVLFEGLSEIGIVERNMIRNHGHIQIFIKVLLYVLCSFLHLSVIDMEGLHRAYIGIESLQQPLDTVKVIGEVIEIRDISDFFEQPQNLHRLSPIHMKNFIKHMLVQGFTNILYIADIKTSDGFYVQYFQ